ncbi:MAG TPA: transcriptional repressor [bacterium]|nr:transcriptional repressor [bacterium]
MKTSLDHSRQTLGRFGALCRERGIPLTVQRRTILELLLQRSDHPTADEIYDAARKLLPDISRTTVYRVLETVVRMGLVRKVSHPGAAVRFDPIPGPHHHLVCGRCDRIFDLDDAASEKIAVKIPKRKDFTIDDYSIYFRGLCAACRNQKKGRDA